MFSFSHCICTLFIWCCRFLTWWTQVLWSKGAIRLDSTWGKKQVWCSNVRNWGLSEANVLYWRKYLWHCWDFLVPPHPFVGPAVIWRCHSNSALGNCIPLHLSRYAFVIGTPYHTALVFIEKMGGLNNCASGSLKASSGTAQDSKRVKI